MKAATVAEMRLIDQQAQAQFGLTTYALMQAAGEAVARRAVEIFGKGAVLIICGKGNNAGDGFLAARELHQMGVPVDVVTMEPPETYKDTALQALSNMRDAGVALYEKKDLTERLERADLIIDALLGTGINGPARNSYAAVIHLINIAPATVLSIDVPSGLRELQPGEQPGPTVSADVTITIGLAKTLLLGMPGNDCAGRIIVETINFPPALLEGKDLALNYESDDTIATWLPSRPLDSNKGTFGNVGIVAGSAPYAGAALLVARAALRSGCGLASIYSPPELNAIYKIALPEATSVIVPSESGDTFDESSVETVLNAANKARVLAVGPGLGTKPATGRFLEKLLMSYNGCMVLDADALNILSDGLIRLLRRQSDCLVTPHPGEMAKLTGKGVSEVQADRVSAARELAVELEIHVLLKGASTVLARPDGQVWVVPGGTSALAKGGTGDVLTGHIAALIAQGVPLWKAAVLGATVHMEAGRRCARELSDYGVLASEVADQLPRAMTALKCQVV